MCSLIVIIHLGTDIKASPFFNNDNMDFDDLIENGFGQGRMPRAVNEYENIEDGLNDYYKEWILENLG